MLAPCLVVINVESQYQIEFCNECCNAFGYHECGEVVVVSALIYQ
jgi:hypothetical protein